MVQKSNTYKEVTANAKKTTTVNKLNDRNRKPTAHSGTFACPNTRATASQAKEPEFSCPQDPNTNDSELDNAKKTRYTSFRHIFKS